MTVEAEDGAGGLSDVEPLVWDEPGAISIAVRDEVAEARRAQLRLLVLAPRPQGGRAVTGRGTVGVMAAEGASAGAAVLQSQLRKLSRSTAVEGFERLFADERVAMVRLAWLLTGSEPAAEEIAQDAFAQVFERWAKLDNPGGYLRRCIMNGCRRADRRRRLERRHAPPALESTWDEGAQDPDLVVALRRLELKRRTVVVLRYWGDCSQAEIADALGLRLGTVKSMLHRALADLRKEIES